MPLSDEEQRAIESSWLYRIYFDPNEIGSDGYPYAWHRIPDPGLVRAGDPSGTRLGLKDVVRSAASNRCIRCGHPYLKGHGGEWSACDEQCRHPGPMRVMTTEGWSPFDPTPEACGAAVHAVGQAEAQWRILTVHHLNGVKHDCRWWNLVSLCQRCHLTIQGKVYMDRPWRREHSEWFKPYVAGYYASSLLGEELTREQTMARLGELLALELTEQSLF